MKITAEFVRSAAAAADFPRDALGEVALVGRSNVGKSSLINALVRQRLARTSAAPGKTRLANIYRVARGGGPPLYLVDLPGYGYARGGAALSRRDARGRGAPASGSLEPLRGAQAPSNSVGGGVPGAIDEGGAPPAFERARGQFEALTRDYFARGRAAAILLVDSRHPGLDADRAAWRWMHPAATELAIVATKIDKLSRAERTRALKQLETAFEDSVLPFSAVTGEGLDELWKLIDRLVSSPKPQRHSSNPAETAPPRPLKKARPLRN